jgi:ABC-type phosphate/phosphonate transport system permease subunit
MTFADPNAHAPAAPPSARDIGDAWGKMVARRRLYTGLGVVILLAAFVASVRFADESNAGHFFDRLPHLFDFLSWLIPKDWNDVWGRCSISQARSRRPAKSIISRKAASMSGAVSTSPNISS